MPTFRILTASLSAALVLAAPLAALAAGDAGAGRAKSAPCAACHGVDGNSTNAQWPKLAGQHPRYLAKQLADFKAGAARANAMMAPMVANLSEQDMQDLAAFFAGQAPADGAADPARVRLGATIYRAGAADRGVPACSGCHGPAGSGNPLAGYPRLSGQHATYVRNQLLAFQAGKRSNDANRSMRDVVRYMTDDEIAAVAEYVSGLY